MAIEDEELNNVSEEDTGAEDVDGKEEADPSGDGEPIVPPVSGDEDDPTTEDGGETGGDDESDPDTEPTTGDDEPTEPDTPAVDPADDPGVVIDFNDFTADKMKTLADKAAEATDEDHIDMITAQILNRVKAQSSKAITTLSVLYASATFNFKEEYREPVKNKLLSLGYDVVEVLEEETPIGITLSWDE